jgi:hypothetical protein
MSERSGIEIDYCPQCRGVWLDRGELDKIIERAAPSNAAWEQPSTPAAPSPVIPQTPVAPTFPPRREEYPRSDHSHGGYRRDHDDDDHKYRKRKKGGFLGDLFDFD